MTDREVRFPKRNLADTPAREQRWKGEPPAQSVAKQQCLDCQPSGAEPCLISDSKAPQAHLLVSADVAPVGFGHLPVDAFRVVLRPALQSCAFDTIPGSKSCMFPEPRYPRNALADGFSPCDLAKLNVAYIRGYRIAYWAAQVLQAIIALPSYLREQAWMLGHNGALAPAFYLGPYSFERLKLARTILDFAVIVFQKGWVSYSNVYKPIEFRYVPTGKSPCKGETGATHGPLGLVKICSGKLQDTSITSLGRTIMHEFMHWGWPGVGDQKTKEGKKAYENLAWVYAIQFPSKAIYNIDCYTMWASDWFDQSEKVCRIIPDMDAQACSFEEGKGECCTYYSYSMKSPPGWKVLKKCS